MRACLNFMKIISLTLKGVILMKFSRRFVPPFRVGEML